MRVSKQLILLVWGFIGSQFGIPATAAADLANPDRTQLRASSLATTTATTTDIESKFVQWMVRHGKTYSSSSSDESAEDGADEFSRRLSIFRDNHLVVTRHNEAFRSGRTKFAMSLDGPFSDLTDEEFERLYLMNPQNCSATHTSSGIVRALLSEKSSKPLPPHVDWRTKGVVTPVKSQNKCGSCWTFSTTGTLEAHHCISEGRDCTYWTGLSEQQLVDCAGAYHNHGCSGGLPSQAFEYIHYSGGIMTEESYPYQGKDGRCHKIRPKKVGAKVRGVFNITSYDEEEIVAAVAAVGPVSVAYQVASDFRLYSHGVYDAFNASTNETVCLDDSQHVNHAVVAVGYGETMEDNPVPFHIIRNSWGNTWGMEGYFWILRGKNLCGISDCASFPLVDSFSAPTFDEKAFEGQVLIH